MFNVSGNHKVNVAKIGVSMDGEVCTVDGYGVDGYAVSSTLSSYTIFAGNPVRSGDLQQYGVWSATLKEYANKVLFCNVVTIQPYASSPIFVQMNPITTNSLSQTVINWTFVNSSGVPVDLPEGAGSVTQFNVFICYSDSST